MKPRRFARASRRGQSGYTLVELMMALALLTVGILGVVSLQKLMLLSNAHAKNMSVAQRIAESWATQLQLDSADWQSGTAGTDWLNQVGGGWIRPAYVGDAKSFGAAFDGLGNPLPDTAAGLARARYCTNVRLTTLYPSDTLTAGNGMMRAEIRVFWLRDGEANLDTAGICKADVPTDSIGLATDRYHFVYHTTGIRQRTSS